MKRKSVKKLLMIVCSCSLLGTSCFPSYASEIEAGYEAPSGGFGGSTEVTQGDAATVITEDGTYEGGSYTSEGDDENALRIEGATVTLKEITVDKAAGATSNTENGDLYGVNAALLATDGANVTIENATVTSSAQNGNGVFSYGEGTVVTISDSAITTTKDNSGGIQTTGGGTTNAYDLEIETSGNSSAAIRSDRGGGTVNVDGGTYTSNGYNSPAVYSTADIAIKNANLTANNSEALVIEGKNSISLTDCTVSGNMSDTQGTSSDENVHNVMIYQSMSGDAAVGTSRFSMTGGTLKSNNGDMIYVTNTDCKIYLSDVTIVNEEEDGNLLTVTGNSASHGWGSAGSNGAQVTLQAERQTLSGDIEVDTISNLDMTLADNSTFQGTVSIVKNAQDGTSVSNNVIVTIEEGSTWSLTGDSTVSELNNYGTIEYNGYTLTVENEEESDDDDSQYTEVKTLVLSDTEITLDDTIVTFEEDEAVYLSHDIIYYEDKDTYESGNPYGEGSDQDKHTAEEAAAQTVVNITEAGVYRLTGSLSAGQIRVDLGEDAQTDETAVVTLILDNVDITCDVAPAILFYRVYECDNNWSEETATSQVDTTAAGANLILADGSKNYATGSHVAIIYKDNDKSKKLWKQDGAVYSYMSMNIDGEKKDTGMLTVHADLEGISSDLHMTINGGNINIYSQDDSINTSEDNVSVMTMNGGTLRIVAGLGNEGDGIDSNGWIVINGGVVIATANANSDSGLDSDIGSYINGGTVIALGSTMDWAESASNQVTMNLQFAQMESQSDAIVIKDQKNNVIFQYDASGEDAFTGYIRQYQGAIISTADFKQGETYFLYLGDTQQMYTGTDVGTLFGGNMGGAPGMGGEAPDMGSAPDMGGEAPDMGDKVPDMDGDRPQIPDEAQMPGGDTGMEQMESSIYFYMTDMVNAFSGVTDYDGEQEIPAPKEEGNETTTDTTTSDASSDSDSSDADSADNDSSSATSSSTVTTIVEEIAPLASSTLEEGHIDFLLTPANAVLKSSLLNQYAGQKLQILAMLSTNLGFSIDAAQMTANTENLDLRADFQEISNFTEGFITYHFVPEQEKVLPYEIGIHVNVGADYSNRTVYVFSLNTETKEYQLEKIGYVNEIGNIAVTTDQLSDRIIFVTK